jgi:hypothetical protein
MTKITAIVIFNPISTFLPPLLVLMESVVINTSQPVILMIFMTRELLQMPPIEMARLANIKK